ncbi:hypothetical protein V6N13_048163 [Hibiscus sabdariffa]
MVQLSALEMAIEVSGIKKFYKFVRTCYQTNLKSYPFAISDEWNVLASKHRRFSSEFDLAKGDGWLKEIEGCTMRTVMFVPDEDFALLIWGFCLTLWDWSSALSIIASHSTIFVRSKDRVMVVIFSPSRIISDSCLSIDAIGSDFGLYERCYATMACYPLLAVFSLIDLCLVWISLYDSLF